MRAKETRNPFEIIFGDKPRSTRGSGTSSKGARARNAIRAGVVKDVPAPKDWLELAAQLPNAPKLEKTPGKMLREEYGFVGNRVTLTSEKFFDILMSASLTKRFQSVGVKYITINNLQGFQGEFEFKQNAYCYWLERTEQLSNVPKPEKEPDEMLNEKYSIVSDRATVTSEKFIDILMSTSLIEQLKQFESAGVKYIAINNLQGFQEEFELKNNGCWWDLESRNSTQLDNFGILAALGEQTTISVYYAKGAPDIRIKHSINPQPATHSMNLKKGTKHRSSQDRPCQHDSSDIFDNCSELRQRVLLRRAIEVIHDDVHSPYYGQMLGKIYHPDYRPEKMASYPSMDFDSLKKKINDHASHPTLAGYLKSIFADSAGIVISGHKKSKPFAIFDAPLVYAPG